VLKYLIIIILSGFIFETINSQNITKRPAIGLTLSGGGAKGLAHIGILKAIDSAGIKVSYVTGTSMGSIIGALYASGYSGKEIEKIARNIDWDLLLTNSSTLRSLIMEEKDEYNKYAVELPWQDKGFRLPNGVIESQELWLKFGELFFPVYNIKDFSKLPRAFQCIATDISTGEMYVLDKGELPYAIRASMAIPSVFTAVEYQNKKLVDGGIVRNFPITNAKEMGAGYVIGSDVSSGLLKKEKINNIFNIIAQIAFFREDADAKKEKKMCDFYIHQALGTLNMGSFSSSAEIIDSGIAKGNEIYPYLKHFADSLNAIYGTDTITLNTVPKIDSVKITDYTINGLHQTGNDFFLHRIQFTNNKKYTATDLTKMIRNAFGTRYYNKVVYTLQPVTDSSARIIFDVDENPLVFAKFGIGYNSFQGVSVISNITLRNFLTDYSRSMISLNIGENMRLKAQHLQFIGKTKSFAVAAGLQAENININTYKDFAKMGAYKRGGFLADISSRFSVKKSTSIGTGFKFESFNYKPQIVTGLSIQGNNSLYSVYFNYKLNTLTNNIYPRKGLKLDLEAGRSINQNAKLKFYDNGQFIPNFADSTKISFEDFSYFNFKMDYYIPVVRKYVLRANVQAGVNFNQKDNSVNNYFIGGLTPTFRNQITFAGLAEGTVMSSSVASINIALRRQIYPSLYVTGSANGLIYDFIQKNKTTTKNSFLTGYALTLGYNLALGPLEISAMYSDQYKTLLSYINLGIPF